MELAIQDLPESQAHLPELLEKAAGLCLQNDGLDAAHAEIDVSFVSAEEIRDLNGTYRAKPEVTDVLSFPQYDDPDEIDTDLPYLLGDVVICLERAEEQAAEYGHGLDRELVYLFVHSVHHLLGYDHEEPEEKRAMRAAEEAVMTALGLERTMEN